MANVVFFSYVLTALRTLILTFHFFEMCLTTVLRRRRVFSFFFSFKKIRFKLTAVGCEDYLNKRFYVCIFFFPLSFLFCLSFFFVVVVHSTSIMNLRFFFFTFLYFSLFFFFCVGKITEDLFVPFPYSQTGKKSPCCKVMLRRRKTITFFFSFHILFILLLPP